MGWFHDLRAIGTGLTLPRGGAALAELLIAGHSQQRPWPSAGDSLFSADDVRQLTAALQLLRASAVEVDSLRQFLNQAREGFSLVDPQGAIDASTWLTEALAFYRGFDGFGAPSAQEVTRLNALGRVTPSAVLEAELLAAHERRAFECDSSGAPSPADDVLQKLRRVFDGRWAFSVVEQGVPEVSAHSWSSPLTLEMAGTTVHTSLYGDSARLKYARFDQLFTDLNRALGDTGLQFVLVTDLTSTVFFGSPTERLMLSARRGIRLGDVGDFNF